MEAAGKFSRATIICVSTSSKLDVEQTQYITGELLRIIGSPGNSSAVKFQFIEAGGMMQANAYVDNQLKISLKE